MHKVIKFAKGVAHTFDVNGNKLNVSSLYGYEPDDCEGDLSCSPPVVRFVDSNGVNREIPLEQLFNFLTDQGVIDTVAPVAPTAMVFSLVNATDFTVDWTAGTDTNLYSHVVTVTETLDPLVVQVIEVLAGTDTTIVTGLTTAVDYTVSIKAKDVGGNLSTALVDTQTTA